MISKLGKMKNSWFVKGVLGVTALSFMSLFGVSSYISGHKNKPAIKVDDVVIYQDQIAMQFKHEQQMAGKMFGDSVTITDEIKNAMLQGIVQRELSNAIITRMGQKYNIYVSNSLVKQIIYSQPEFRTADGKFDPSRFRQLLSMSGWDEAQYIDNLKKDLIKQQIIYEPIKNFNVPKVMAERLAMIENNKKIFKYVKIDPRDIKIGRSISEEELDQYYNDFAQNFMEPETRDVSVVLLSMQDMENRVVPTEQEIEEYYNANLDHYVVPETRDIAQMTFNNREAADKAYAELQSGKSFMQVAESIGQSKNDTNMGYMAQDAMLPELGGKVFALAQGAVLAPTQSEMGWHIMMVKDIKLGSKKSIEQAKAEIVAQIKKDKADDEVYDVSKQIEDRIAAGTALEDIAKQMNVPVLKITKLAETGNAADIGKAPKNLTVNPDFIETVFSYGKGETSQIVETDSGFAVVRIDAIHDTHLKDRALVAGDIKKMWEENERTSLTQEKVNDVLHDMEDGDDLETVGPRFGLTVSTTAPLKRSSSFAGLNKQQMLDLFHENLKTPKTFNVGNSTIIAMGIEDINAQAALGKEELDAIKTQARIDQAREYSKIMLDAYAKEFDVRVKWRLIGLDDGI